jgi:hypothetical protein
MYKIIETDKEAKWGSGHLSTTVIPVVTMENQYGHKVQIINHDNSYIILLQQKDDTYKTTAWIFPEALEILRTLPNPRTHKLEALI